MSEGVCGRVGRVCYLHDTSGGDFECACPMRNALSFSRTCPGSHIVSTRSILLLLTLTHFRMYSFASVRASWLPCSFLFSLLDCFGPLSTLRTVSCFTDVEWADILSLFFGVYSAAHFSPLQFVEVRGT